jgi:hypothetical protein
MNGEGPRHSIASPSNSRNTESLYCNIPLPRGLGDRVNPALYDFILLGSTRILCENLS